METKKFLVKARLASLAGKKTVKLGSKKVRIGITKSGKFKGETFIRY